MTNKTAHTPIYEVTADGRVFSCSTNWRGHGKRELRQTPNADGYPSVRVILWGRRRRMAVHRLVAQYHLPPRPSPRHEVRHLNGIKTDNRAVNLAWGTCQDNANDRASHGRTSSGTNHSEAIKRGLRVAREAR